MSKVVLHIGTHKTATTTLQDTFYANADLLAKHGVVYPRFSETGAYTGHHGLVPNWDAMPKTYALPRGRDAVFDDLVSRYKDTDTVLFLSSEEFSRQRSMRELHSVRDALSGFDSIEVICTLRTQWQFLQSVYLEVSKTRVPSRPPQLVTPVIESGTYEGLWVDYNSLLDRLEEVFAPENITFFDFDTCRRSEGGILGVFLRHLGVPVDPSVLEQVNGGVSNRSPVALASWAANILTEPRVAPSWLVKTCEDSLKAEFGKDLKACLFTREEFRMLQEHFEARNDVLRDRRAPYQPDFAISAADVASPTLFRGGINSSSWVRMSRRIVSEVIRSSNAP